MLRLFLLLSLLIAAATKAEDKKSSPIQIDELIAQALADNPELIFYRAEIAAAKGERRSAGAWPNPEFSSDLGRKSVRSSGLSSEGVAWAASASQTFEWPGRVSLRKAIASQQIELATNGFEQFKAALGAEVRQRAFALFAAQRRVAATQEVARRGEELVATLVQREVAGPLPLLESRAVEASIIKLKRDAAEASKEVLSALFKLNQLRGRPISTALVIAEPVSAFSELPSPVDLIRLAARENFELKQRESELVQQGFKVRLSQNEAWPSVTIGAQFSREKVADERERLAGLSVKVPLPLWNRNEGGIEAAKARLLQAQTTLRLAQREVERKIREQSAAYEISRAEIARWNPKIVEQLREAAVLADRHYRLGAVPLATYLEVQQSYLEALQAIFATQSEALQARAELQLLTGKTF
ncbi:MAG: TolC family protein [Verrucomicrobia bacterium]|nr:TolC family protein [Verrucomicrobiota bacterium]